MHYYACVQVRFFVRLSAVLLPELGAARRVAHLFSYLLVHTRIDQEARQGIGLDGRRVGRASMGDAAEDAARSHPEAAARIAAADGGGSSQCRPQAAGGASSSASEHSGGRGRKGAVIAAKPNGGKEESFSKVRRYSRESAG